MLCYANDRGHAVRSKGYRSDVQFSATKRNADSIHFVRMWCVHLMLEQWKEHEKKKRPDLRYRIHLKPIISTPVMKCEYKASAQVW